MLYLIGATVVAVVLALWLRPAYLVVLGLTTMAGAVVLAMVTDRVWGQCEDQCPHRQHLAVGTVWVLVFLALSLLLLALAKRILITLRRHRVGSGFLPNPPRNP